MNSNKYLNGVNLYDEKCPLIIKRNYINDSTIYVYFDGNKKWEGNKEYYIKLLKSRKEHEHILIDCLHCQNCKRHEIHKEIEECYFSTIEQIDLLKKLTKGKINLRITGTIRNTIYKLFFEMNEDTLKDSIESVDIEEVEWIEKATQGALNYKYFNTFKIQENETKFKGYKYDINSCYPSILSSQCSFPISKGEFKILDEFKHEYGIYRLNEIYVENYRTITNDFNSAKLFPKKLFYTHTDIIQLIKDGKKIVLADDGEPNALIYKNETRMKGNKIFKKYVDYLYKIKINHKECKYAKTLLNNLWGLFCQKDTINFYYKKDIENIQPFICDDACEVKALMDSKREIIGYEYVNINHYYKGLLPRLKPFLLSFGRQKIYNLGLPYFSKDELLAVFTDSLILTKEIENFENSTKIGELKYEGQIYYSFNEIID